MTSRNELNFMAKKIMGGKLVRELAGAVLLLVSIAMLIPVPSSTEERYQPNFLVISIQTTLFFVSRWLSRGRQYFWLTIVEVLLFGAVSYISALSSTII